MKCRLSFMLLALFCAVSVGASAQIQTSINFQYTAINYPGALPQETLAYGININNLIVGEYPDPSSGAAHGFTLSNGNYTSFDFPGAVGTHPRGVSDTGDIVGWYELSDNSTHGFLLHDGIFSSIDVPGSSWTVANGINSSGTIVGAYNNEIDAYILKNGNFSKVKVPGVKGFPNYYTMLNGISNNGEFVGQVLTGDYWRGFWGTRKDIDFLEPAGRKDNQLNGVNDRGDVVGCHDSGAPFVVFNPEPAETSEHNEPYPTVEYLEKNPHFNITCAEGINHARAIVGNPGFLDVPKLTLNMTSPQNHSTQNNPVHVAASAVGINRISQIQVWVNSVEIYHVNGGKLNARIPLPTGNVEAVVIQAVDSKGVMAMISDTITVK